MDIKSPILLAISSLLLAGCAFPMSGQRGETFLPIMDPDVRFGQLENGLTFYIRDNNEPSDRAELRLVVNVGSVLEDDDQRGLAHIVEHMAFNGTRSFEGPEIVNFLESVGMRFGPDVNAYTSFDETVYMLTLPTDNAEVLEKGIQILEEWATAITFDSLQVEQERSVVYEEWRLGQGAGSRIQAEQFPTLTARSRYADRLPIGTPESLNNFTHDALRRFYDDWYRPDLMAVVAVGDFDPDEIEAQIRQRFGPIPAPEQPRPRREYNVPSHRETLLSIATDRELTSSTVSIYLKRQPKPWTDERAYREWIVESLAASMLVNRLNEYTQQVDSPFLDVSSFQGRFVRSLSTFVLNARIPEARVATGLRQMLYEIQRAARFGFTESELEREQREMMRVMEQRYAEREKTTSGSFAADYVSHFLYGGTLLDTEKEYRLYEELIPSVTVREANRRVQDWTSAQDRVILVSTPEGDDYDRPSDDRLRQVVEAAPRYDVRPYTDSISAAPLIRNIPNPGSVVEEVVYEDVGITRWRLSNGANFYLRPNDHREEEVLFAARSPGGSSLVEDEDHIAALTATAVVQAGGVGELSPNDLRKRLAGRLVGVGADISQDYEGLSGAASPRDLETLFQLAYLKFTAPRPDTTAFLAYQAQARSSLANRSASPQVAFRDTLQVALTQNHPRARPPSPSMFDRLDMTRSFEIFEERFANAGDFDFYLVGNFDLEEVRPMVERYIASLPSTGETESARDLGIRTPDEVVRKIVRRGMEPRAATQIVFTGEMEFTRENVRSVQTLADVLRIRLRESLREDLGGTYGVSVSSSVSQDPVGRYQVAIGFGSDPERLDELTRALFDDIEILKREGPSANEISKVLEMQYRSRETEIPRNQFWLMQMLAYNRYGWDLNTIPAGAEREIRGGEMPAGEAARAFLDLNRYVHVVLVPEGWEGTIPLASGTNQLDSGIQ